MLDDFCYKLRGETGFRSILLAQRVQAVPTYSEFSSTIKAAGK